MKPIPKLSLNRNPRNIQSGSIVCAKNMMLDDNGECFVNDNGIEEPADFPTDAGNIYLVIPAIDEVVYVCENKILRYKEIDTTYYDVPAGITYKPRKGIKLCGAYYYNVRNELIIAIGEQKVDETIPLYTMNLDLPVFPLADSTTIPTTALDYDAVAPPIPTVKFEATVTPGRAKKGNYHFFIRFCFNEVDKTKWMHIGYPVTLHSMRDATTLYSVYDTTNNAIAQCADVYSDESNSCGCSFSVKLTFGNYVQSYIGYDIAVLIEGEDANLAYEMLSKPLTTEDESSFNFNPDNLRPISIDELTEQPLSISNVGQMTVHGNRLYVADYEEVDNNPDVLEWVEKIVIKYNREDVHLAGDRIADKKSGHIMVDPRNSLIERLNKRTLISREVYNFFVHLVRPDGTHTNGYKVSTTGTNFTVYTNDAGDTLFQVPGDMHQPNSLDGVIDAYAYTILVSNTDVLPEGYVGYFISYEYPERTVLMTGIGTTGDFLKGTSITGNVVDIVSNSLYFNDRPDLTGSTLYTKTTLDSRTQQNTNTDSDKYTNLGVNLFNCDPNRIQSVTAAEYSISKATYFPNGIGTPPNTSACLRLTMSSNVSWSTYPNIVQICKNAKNVYMGKNKTLIPFGYVFAGNQMGMIPYGAMPGFITWDINYVFSQEGVVAPNLPPMSGKTLDYTGCGDASIPRNNDGKQFKIKAFHPVGVVACPIHSHQLMERKIGTFKYTTYYSPEDRDEKDADRYNMFNKFITPVDALNIVRFRKLGDPYCPVFYTNVNFDPRQRVLTKFTRTLRRSRIIQDESVANSWRLFRPNDYKVIAENKGAITNIVSLGVYLLVHCEHSLFLFNGENSIQAQDKNIQMQMPDIFDMGYSEVFTSQKGFAGLQDSVASNIAGDFGYIFYDRSARCIYRFDAGKLTPISDDIAWIMNFIKPARIIMTFDNLHDRILMCMLDDDDEAKLTISYSTRTNSFISLHDFKFRNAFYTKENTYILNNGVDASKVMRLRINDTSNEYGEFLFEDGIYPTYVDEDNADKVLYYVDVIQNTVGEGGNEYPLLLAGIRYISNKYKINDIPTNPADLAEVFPYPCDKIKAYSDVAANMTEVDVSVGDEGINPFEDEDKWKKTMYDKGWYTFTHFRFDAPEGEEDVSDNKRMIYGKYIVVRFIFINDDNDTKVRLESVVFNIKQYT